MPIIDREGGIHSLLDGAMNRGGCREGFGDGLGEYGVEVDDEVFAKVVEVKRRNGWMYN